MLDSDENGGVIGGTSELVAECSSILVDLVDGEAHRLSNSFLTTLQRMPLSLSHTLLTDVLTRALCWELQYRGRLEETLTWDGD